MDFIGIINRNTITIHTCFLYVHSPCRIKETLSLGVATDDELTTAHCIIVLLFDSVVGMIREDEIVSLMNIGVVVVIPLWRVAAVFAASPSTIQPIIVPVPEQMNGNVPPDLLNVV